MATHDRSQPLPAPRIGAHTQQHQRCRVRSAHRVSASGPWLNDPGARRYRSSTPRLIAPHCNGRAKIAPTRRPVPRPRRRRPATGSSRWRRACPAPAPGARSPRPRCTPPRPRANCKSSSSSAVASLAHNVSRSGARGQQRHRRPVDVEPRHARPADLLGQRAIISHVASDRQQRPRHPRPAQPPWPPREPLLRPRCSTVTNTRLARNPGVPARRGLGRHRRTTRTYSPPDHPTVGGAANDLARGTLGRSWPRPILSLRISVRLRPGPLESSATRLPVSPSRRLGGLTCRGAPARCGRRAWWPSATTSSSMGGAVSSSSAAGSARCCSPACSPSAVRWTVSGWRWWSTTSVGRGGSPTSWTASASGTTSWSSTLRCSRTPSPSGACIGTTTLLWPRDSTRRCEATSSTFCSWTAHRPTPPGTGMARYPALPVLHHRLAPAMIELTMERYGKAFGGPDRAVR